MNKIPIFAPRWRDRKILIAEWKIGRLNEISILSKKADGTRFYPEPFIVSGERLKSYPLEIMKHGKMRVVDLDKILELHQ